MTRCRGGKLEPRWTWINNIGILMDIGDNGIIVCSDIWLIQKDYSKIENLSSLNAVSLVWSFTITCRWAYLTSPMQKSAVMSSRPIWSMHLGHILRQGLVSLTAGRLWGIQTSTVWDVWVVSMLHSRRTSGDVDWTDCTMPNLDS